MVHVRLRRPVWHMPLTGSVGGKTIYNSVAIRITIEVVVIPKHVQLNIRRPASHHLQDNYETGFRTNGI